MIIKLILITIYLSQLNPNQAGESKVTVLDSDSFNSFFENNKNYKILVFFGSSKCVHCVNFKETYNKLAYDLSITHETTVKLAKIDCNTDRNICKRYSINSYPSFMVFKDMVYYKFNDRRSYDNLAKFVDTDYLNNKIGEFKYTDPTRLEETISILKEIVEEFSAVLKEGPPVLKGMVIILLLSMGILFIFILYSVYYCVKGDTKKEKVN